MITPEFDEQPDYTLTWTGGAIISICVAVVLFLVILVAENIDSLSWIGYIILSIAAFLLILRYVIRNILNK